MPLSYNYNSSYNTYGVQKNENYAKTTGDAGLRRYRHVGKVGGC